MGRITITHPPLGSIIDMWSTAPQLILWLDLAANATERHCQPQTPRGDETWRE